MVSVGKRFETQFAKSVPDYCLVYRIPDSAQAFGRSENIRFSRKNAFDYLVWDSKRHRLFALELKTVGGKAISFERSEEDKGEIHWHQIQGLDTWNAYDGITCGFVIEFREMELTVFIDIDSFHKLIQSVGKKSFGIKDMDDYDVPYLVIPQWKPKVHYRYDVEKLLSQENY